MNTEQARFNMVQQQIRPWLVSDPHVLGLLQNIHREHFCPPAHRALAFMDLPIPTAHGQTMLEPRIQARMVQDLQLTATDRVLQIGAGTGFVTALLACTAKSVTAWETHADIAQMARANLQRAGIGADLRIGCGIAGAQSDGPYNAILLCGSVPAVPDSLLAQLAHGGRLLAVIGEEPIMHAHRYIRHSDGSLADEELWDIVIPRLQGVPEPSQFAL